MKDESFEIHSPYIKNSSNGIDEMRKKLFRKNQDEEDNLLSFKHERNTSDTILRQTILNLSKKAVGEEIRRFAEVASREIGEEFERLENRINQKINSRENSSLVFEVSKRVGNVEKAFYEEMTNQNENIMSVRENLGKEIDRKIDLLNKKLIEIEEKIKTVQGLSTYTPSSQNTNASTVLVDALLIEGTGKEEGVNDVREEDLSLYANINKEEQANYVNKKMRSTISLFEKEGALFKKNTFISKIKSLEAEDFLNFKEGYKDIEDRDKEKIENIMLDLMENLDIDPKEGETIEDFLKRSYGREYAKMV